MSFIQNTRLPVAMNRQYGAGTRANGAGGPRVTLLEQDDNSTPVAATEPLLGTYEDFASPYADFSSPDAGDIAEPFQMEEPVYPALMYLLMGILIATAATAGGLELIGKSFAQPSIHPGLYGVLQWSNFFGVLVILVGVSIGLWSLLFGLTLWNANRSSFTDSCHSVLVGTLEALFFGAMAASIVLLIVPNCGTKHKPGETTGDDWPKSNGCNTFLQLCGIAFTVAFGSLGTTLFSHWNASNSLALGNSGSTTLASIFLGSIAVMLYLLSGFLPQYSIPTSGAFFTKSASSNSIFELRTDCLVYFGAFVILITAGVLIEVKPWLKLWLTRPASGVNKILKIFCCAWRYTMSVGEFVIVVGFCCFSIFWGVWWGMEHTQKGADGFRIASSIFGHLASLFMATIAFPVSRNNVFVAIFQIPYQSFLSYHKILGYITYLLLTVHMVLWMIKWLGEGSLASNVVSIDFLEISSNEYHYDNFTVVLAEIAWIMASAIIFTALLCRRRNYEIFYYVHHLGIIIYFVALLHAWNFWYYGGTGLLLWWVDVCQRTLQQLRRYKMCELKHLPKAEVTLIAFDAPQMRHESGQFVRIQIPELSVLSWHPFYVFSHPRRSRKVLVVQDLGTGTWTGELAQLTYTMQDSNDRRSSVNSFSNPELSIVPSLLVEGPYGRFPSIEGSDEVLLVAGGIGVSAFHSLLAELVLRELRDECSAPTVHLVWVMRNPALVDLCAELLVDASNLAPFKISLFCTTPISSEDLLQHTDGYSSRSACSKAMSTMIFGRRPPLDRIIGKHAAASDPQMLVCGPDTLNNECVSLAIEHNTRCHVEPFRL
eukprot:gb/GECG01009439.1/.p1 GENE.gb/GECG01009439.1/~~gb/GECG01009439.1/.p1  ORF type:complete len:825 (+),score=42.55 gb/GECG01009439.1/:1-2475(+)